MRRGTPRVDGSGALAGRRLNATTGGRARAAGVVVGAVLGFAVAAVTYAVLGPLLEDTWARDLQGLLWNVVPVLTVVGAAVGWSVSGR